MTEQTTRMHCPISSCEWHHDDPGPSAAGAFATDPNAVMTAHVMNMEGIVREHLETHPLIEWAREVMRLRNENQQGGRVAGLTVAVLLRRLGGSAEISDADMAAESGTLVREPVMHGFRLAVR